MSKEAQGYFYATFAFLFWGGLSPIYFKEVATIDSTEVLLYRIVFSVFILLPLIFYKKEIGLFFTTIKDMRKIKYLLASTFFVSINWLIFIWAVSNGKILETSLGYYINPLVNVVFGYFFFSERVSISQYFAIFIALLAVIYQLLTLGHIPYIAFSLAFSFAFYGLLRKKINVSSQVGLFVEVLLLFPFAIGYLIYLYLYGNLSFIQNSSSYISFMLFLAGFVTVIPLLLFNSAAIRIRLTTLGFFQYIGPTASFLLAIFIYNEDFNNDKLITFILIWFALVIFSFDSIKKVLINR
ncbi:EamA family transporter RarD [Arcobacter arenosus]|uniref:EamA family transporter RarD n=1 Tax=Arcobacter arenosus TaxID=2576037 RepID=A0A5R8Y0Q4_9BACT|nr:EamA family transporter RarD [Arcobacter arenosus]TLP38439.1 EamA family transporter RarD [Arcobacter arenosus]